jgi:hypothetical protein
MLTLSLAKTGPSGTTSTQSAYNADGQMIAATDTPSVAHAQTYSPWINANPMLDYLSHAVSKFKMHLANLHISFLCR